MDIPYRNIFYGGIIKMPGMRASAKANAEHEAVYYTIFLLNDMCFTSFWFSSLCG